jgi:hypothetical protein
MFRSVKGIMPWVTTWNTVLIFWFDQHGQAAWLTTVSLRLCKIRDFHSSDYEDVIFCDVTPCGSCKNGLLEEHNASTIRVERISKIGTTLLVTSNCSTLQRTTRLQLQVTANIVLRLLILSILIIEAMLLWNVSSYKSHTASHPRWQQSSTYHHDCDSPKISDNTIQYTNVSGQCCKHIWYKWHLRHPLYSSLWDCLSFSSKIVIFL